MNPKVSIIIPIYNTAPWLPKCLESCLAQTYDNIEIVLIEDGSPDNCGEICDSFAEKDARVTVIHQENRGVSAARNAGLERASGELILFVDSDDWIDPDMVKRMVEGQLAGQYDLVICGVRHFRNEQIVLEKSPAKKEALSRIDVISCLLDHRNLRYFTGPWVKLCKKSIIEKFDLNFDTSLKASEDFLFVLDYLEHTGSCLYLNKAFYNCQLETYDKSAHYQLADAEYQWKNKFIVVDNFRKLFINTGTYAELKDKVDMIILRAIKLFLNTTISAHCSGKAIISQVKAISASKMYGDLKAIHSGDVDDLQEKIVLICCKNRLWNTLYMCFKLKIFLYDRMYKKVILQVKSRKLKKMLLNHQFS